ncbi:MAG: flippase [Candidatus Uhrbacteria bacterium]
MHRSRVIMTQTGIQLAGKMVSIALGVVAIAIITRGLGLEGYGKYAIIMAYLQLFGIAVDLGLNVLAPKMLGELQVDEHPASSIQRQALLSNIFTMRLTAAVIVFAIAAAVAFRIPVYDQAVRIGIALATFSFLGIVLTQILQAPFQVAARMGWPTAAEIIGRVVLVGALAYAAWSGMGLMAIVAATVIGNVCMTGVVFVAAQRLVRVRLAFDFALWRGILTQSWPIALSIVFNLVYLRADQVLLSFMKPAAHVGIYAAPYRLLDVLTQFPHLVMGLVLPMLAGAWVAGDRARFHDRLQRVFDGLAFLGIPVVAGAMVLGVPLMTLVAGDQFAVSGPVLGVLSLALLGIFLGQPFGYAVVAVNAQRRMLWGYAIVAVVTLIGYCIVIPLYSYWGAAWLTVVSEVAIATITFSVVRRASALRLNLRTPLAALAAAVAMALALLATPTLHVLTRVAVGVIVYALVAFAMPWTRKLLRGVWAE